MNQEFNKVDGNLVITVTVPMKNHRSNPWDDKENSEMDNIVGVIAGDELSFAYWIDMDYKGKADQISIPWFMFHGTEEEFTKLCAELGIETYKYETCSECHKVIYCSSTYTQGKGPLCFDCEQKL
jgi:hypothetical protein